MEKQQELNSIQTNLSHWLNRIKVIENLADKMDMEVIELENECSSKKSFMDSLQGFNNDRNDLRTFCTIQRDYQAEAYIKQLESTLEIVMGKYRNHLKHQIEETKLNFDELIKDHQYCNCINMINKQNLMVDGLITMFKEFMSDGEDLTNILLNENMRLKTENKELRKIVEITNKYLIEEANNNQM